MAYSSLLHFHTFNFNFLYYSIYEIMSIHENHIFVPMCSYFLSPSLVVLIYPEEK